MSGKDFSNDADILASLAKGDQRVFKQIYDKYWETIHTVANRFLRSPELADDIVQEVFSMVWIRRREFQEVKNVKAYLIICARNAIFKQLKEWANERKVNGDYAAGLDHAVDNIDHKILGKQYDALVEQALQSLPPQQRVVFRMAKVEGLTHEAIAAKLGISRITVKSYMGESLQFIRQKISPYIGVVALMMAKIVDVYY